MVDIVPGLQGRGRFSTYRGNVAMKKIVFLFILLSTLLFSVTSSFALTVEETPSVQNIFITPSINYSGSVITIKAEVGYSALDVTSLSFIFLSPSGNAKKVANLEYDKSNRVFIGSLTIENYDEKGPGIWIPLFFII